MPRHREPNTLLADLLAEADWSAAAFARAVNLMGRAQGLTLRYDRSAVAHWLAGSRPKAPVPELAAEVLTRRTGRLIRAVDTGLTLRTPGQDSTVPAPEAPGRDDPVRRLVALARADADPARRPQLLGIVYRQHPVAGHDHETPAAPPAAQPQTDTHTSTPRTDRLRIMLGEFVSYTARFGGGHARAAPAAYVGDDVGRLLAAPTPPAARADLLSATAQLAHVLADMTADAGHQGLAQRYYRLALEITLEAGNRRQSAITLRAMSLQAARLGAPRYALALADAAVAAGTSYDADLRAFVLVQRAYARSLQGQGHARDARNDLHAAEHALARSTDRPGPFTSYPEAAFAYRKGQTLHKLNDTTAALSALRHSALRRAPEERRHRALTQARLALILMDLGRLEEACAHGRALAADYPWLHSSQTTWAMDTLRSRLAAFPRVPEAAALLAMTSEQS
jgi:tetratricopeptide (TPR) repeat protein